MGLTGKFGWYESVRQGGRRDVTFTLTCDNLLQSETFNCALIAYRGLAQPMVFQQLKLKPKQSYSFNYDTVDWQWCDGDTFALLDRKNNIIKQWPLQFQPYRPGECPECHGTKVCGICKGKGYVVTPDKMIDKCTICGSTGVCHTCYIPQRTANNSGQHTPIVPDNDPDMEKRKEKRIASLRDRIRTLEGYVEREEWSIRMMELNGQSTRSMSLYNSKLNQKYRYESQLIDLRSQLDQLENI